MPFKAKPPRNKVMVRTRPFDRHFEDEEDGMAHHYDWGPEDEDEILLRKEREAREAMKTALAEEDKSEQSSHEERTSK